MSRDVWIVAGAVILAVLVLLPVQAHHDSPPRPPRPLPGTATPRDGALGYSSRASAVACAQGPCGPVARPAEAVLPRPAPGSLGAVGATLFLPNGTLVVGNPKIPACLGPSFGVLDPNASGVVISCYEGPLPDRSNGSVLLLWDPSSGAVIANAPDPDHPNTLAYDAAHGRIDVADIASNSIRILDATTLGTVGRVAMPGPPDFLVLDPRNGYAYVAISGLNRVVFLNTSTDHIDGSVGVGSAPSWEAYDTGTDEVYVSNLHGANLSVVNATSNTVVASVPVGSNPTGVGYDPFNGRLYVGHATSANLTEVNETSHRSTTSILSAANVGSVVYSAPRHDVYVADFGRGAVSVLDPGLGQIVANLTVRSMPLGLVDDPLRSRLYVLDDGSAGLITVLDSRNRTVRSESALLSFPTQVVVDSQDGLLFESGGNNAYNRTENVTMISIATRRVVGSIPVAGESIGLAYDPIRDVLYISDEVNDLVRSVNASTLTLLPTLPVGRAPIGMLFDPGTRRLFVANINSNNVTVVDTVSGTSVGSFGTGGSPFSPLLDPMTGQIFVPNEGTNNVTVVNATTFAPITSIQVGSFPAGAMRDPASGEILVTDEVSGDLRVIDPSTDAVVRTVRVGAYPIGMAYDPFEQRIFVANAGSDNLSVLSALGERPVGSITGGLTMDGIAFDRTTNSLATTDFYGSAITFVDLPPPPTFPIDFFETGLPAGTNWSVAVNGTAVWSTSADLVVAEPNGSDYRYQVDPVPGYSAAPTGGHLGLEGGGLVVPIAFQPTVPPTYNVTFSESGLLAGTNWSVTFGGVVNASTGPSIGFAVPNGSAYPFTVGPAVHYVASPSAGSLDVAGGPVARTITFTPVTPAPRVTSIVAEPASPVVGRAMTLTATIEGGEPPLTLTWVDLPGGCPGNAGDPYVTCTPTAPGNFSVSLSVEDALGRNASEVLPLRVSAAPSPGGSAGEAMLLGLPATTAYVVIAAAVALIAGTAVLAFRARRPPPGDSRSPPPEP